MKTLLSQSINPIPKASYRKSINALRFSLALSIAALSLLAACEISTGAGEDGFGYEPNSFTVTFNSNGGYPVSPIKVKLYSTIPPIEPIKGYKFEGWYKDAALSQPWDIAIDVVIGNITLYANWGDGFANSFVLGETGLGGGKIFYVAPGGFDMTDTGKKCYYLEAAPEDCNGSPLEWSLDTGTVGAGLDIIGAGRKNTALILAAYPTAPAAFACSDYRGPNNKDNNKDDWFLPSRDELYELYKYNVSFGDLGLNTVEYYWSSSESSPPRAWARVFNSGLQGDNDKTIPYRVRAIRAF